MKSKKKVQLLAETTGGVAEEYYQGFGTIDVDKIITDCLDDNLKNILEEIEDVE